MRLLSTEVAKPLKTLVLSRRHFRHIRCLPLISLGLPTLLASHEVRAQAAATPAFAARITVDMALMGGWSRDELVRRFSLRDDAVGQRVQGQLALGGSGFAAGGSLGAALRVIRKLALGLQATYIKEYDRLRSPLADALGIEYGRRDLLDLSVLVECQPFATDFAPRQGWFVQGAIGPTLNNYRLKPSAYQVEDRPVSAHITAGGGYRFLIDSRASLATAVFFRFENEITVGLRVGGGFQ